MYSTQHQTMTHLSAMKKWQSQDLRGEDSSPSTNGQRTSFIRTWTNFVSGNYLPSMWSGNNPLSVTIVNGEILNSNLLENSSMKNKDLTYISQEKKLLPGLSKPNYPQNYVLPMLSMLEHVPMNQYWPSLTNKIKNDVNLLKNFGNTFKGNSKMESHSLLRVNKAEKSIESTINYPNPLNVNPQKGDIYEDMDVESFFVVSHSDVSAAPINFRENPMSRLSNVCRNIWNSLTSRLYCKPESTRMFVKRPLYLAKHRRKANAITVGRGRGRAKCQLRRSGVSQTIWNRKECIKSDDETCWQNNLVDITVNDCSLDNNLDSLGSNVDTVDFAQATRQITSPTIPSSSRATSTKGKPKARKKKKTKAKNITKVHYISNSSRMNDCCEDSNGEMSNVREDSFRLRTLSENSSDGWIVFEDDHDDDEWLEIREKQEATEYPTEGCCVNNFSIRMSDRTCKDSEIYKLEQASFRLRLSSESSTDSENSSRSSTDSKQQVTEYPRMHYDHLLKISDKNRKDYSSIMQKTVYQPCRLLLNCSNDSDDSKSDISDSSSEENDVDDCDEVSFHGGDSQLEDDLVVFTEEDNEELTAQTKKVKFNLQPVVHVMIAWDYAYRAARKGHWEQFARDNERFRGRINSISIVLDPILKNQHRSQVWQERFAFPD